MYSRYNPVFTAILYSTLYTKLLPRMEPTTPRSKMRQRKILLARRFRRRVRRTRRDTKGDVRMMRCMWCCGRLGEDLSRRMWSVVCTELLQCMHGACIMNTAMHATVRVRKFVVNKISNGPGDDFLRAPIQIMTPSNRSHPTPTSQRQGSMLPGSQARRASARAVESVQTELTGQTRVYSPPQGRGRACAP